MVSYAGKELLKNSINTANFHNRIQEEKLTWRQFELEKGLTMMVSDDIIRKRHLCKHHAEKRKREQEKEKERRRQKQIAKLEKAKSRAEALEKWDHSGFEELYPNAKYDGEKPMKKIPTKKSKKKQFSRSRSPPSKKKRKINRSDVDKWDHSGYKKLYPDVQKKRYSSPSSSSLSSSPTSSSYSDIRSRSSRRSLRQSSPSSSSSSVSSSLSSSPTTSSSSDYEQTRREIKKIYGRGSSSSSKGDLQTSRSRSRQKKSRHQ